MTKKISSISDSNLGSGQTRRNGAVSKITSNRKGEKMKEAIVNTNAEQSDDAIDVKDFDDIWYELYRLPREQLVKEYRKVEKSKPIAGLSKISTNDLAYATAIRRLNKEQLIEMMEIHLENLEDQIAYIRDDLAEGTWIDGEALDHFAENGDVCLFGEVYNALVNAEESEA